jgi:hypothetical protein
MNPTNIRGLAGVSTVGIWSEIIHSGDGLEREPAQRDLLVGIGHGR